MSRRCEQCPTSSMADDVFHLHELPEGASFRFAGTQPQLQLVEITPASCRISSGPVKKVRLITPRFGEPREVEFEESGVHRCAPCSMVERVN